MLVNLLPSVVISWQHDALGEKQSYSMPSRIASFLALSRSGFIHIRLERSRKVESWDPRAYGRAIDFQHVSWVEGGKPPCSCWGLNRILHFMPSPIRSWDWMSAWILIVWTLTDHYWLPDYVVGFPCGSVNGAFSRHLAEWSLHCKGYIWTGAHCDLENIWLISRAPNGLTDLGERSCLQMCSRRANARSQ